MAEPWVPEIIAETLAGESEDFQRKVRGLYAEADEVGRKAIVEFFEQGGPRLVDEALVRWKQRRDNQ